MKVLCLVAASAALVAAAPKDSNEVTFYRDVLPVIQKNCQGCHRPGEAAPISFATYKETRPWAKAIREAVATRRMPPWFADPHVGKFANDRSLSQTDIATLVKWTDNGAVEGNPKDAPPPVRFVEGWNIGTPELTIEMPVEYNVPASGTIEYTYFVVPTGFTEDRWIQLAEVRPGNRKVVHHVIAFVREPGSKWLQEAKVGEPYVPKKNGSGEGREGGFGGEFLVGYAPGYPAESLAPGQAKRIKAGSDIVLQMHYTADGKAQSDRTRVGFIFAKEPPKERVFTLAAGNTKFVIPPGADNHKVESQLVLHEDSTLVSMLPHMHLRGKAFDFRLVYPNGEVRELLRVPRYDFNWQLTYKPIEPIALPKGSRIECTAWYDNSPNNKFNPDPKAEVRFGDQSWEEMMFGFFNVAFDPALSPRDLMQPPKKKAAASSGAEE
jgi:hypothetical protein